MHSITGIELGPDSCVVVRARTRGAAVEVSALHQIERAAWPAHDTALAATLHQLRRAKRFPRRARLVAWGLSEPAHERDPVVRSLVKPLLAAGFRVERVLTPPEALAEIARTRSRGRGVAVAWLAVNVHGAAVAIVRDGVLLYGHTFDWHYVGDARDPRTEMLQRYSLVAHLAPEVRRGTAQARGTHGAIVEAAVTCGDLPDLRSLTMPLIEELDLEVETLDSTEGLVARGRARSDRFTESAPAIRLAAAAATIRPPRRRPASGVGSIVRIAAAAAIVAAVGWYGYRSWIDTAPSSPPVMQTGRTPSASGRGATPVSPPTSRGTPPAAPPSEVRAPSQAQAPAAAAQDPAPTAQVRPPVGRTVTVPATTPTSPAPALLERTAPPPPAITATPTPVTQQRAPGPPALPPPASATPAQSAARPPAATPVEPPEDEGTVDPTTTRADISRRRTVPLKAPLPSVESILVASDRRVARVDGRIVTVGDQIGARVVAGIEPDAVVLQEPSGNQIRVPIRRGRSME